jgi:hypothetical protein
VQLGNRFNRSNWNDRSTKNSLELQEIQNYRKPWVAGSRFGWSATGTAGTREQLELLGNQTDGTLVLMQIF